MHLLKREKTKNQFMATTSLSDKMQAMILLFPPQTVFCVSPIFHINADIQINKLMLPFF